MIYQITHTRRTWVFQLVYNQKHGDMAHICLNQLHLCHSGFAIV